MRTVGQIEQPQPEPARRARQGQVVPGTRAWVFNEWTRRAGETGRRSHGNKAILVKTISRLRKEQRYTYEEIGHLVSVFFVRHDISIRNKHELDLAVMFTQQLNQGLEDQAGLRPVPIATKPRRRQLAKTGAEVMAELLAEQDGAQA